MGDVLLHLRDQGLDGSKLQFVAEFCHQVQAERPAVEVGVEVEQVGLDGVRVRIAERGAHADAGDRPVNFGFAFRRDRRETGVYAVGGHGERLGEVQIGRWKAEVSSASGAAHYSAGERRPAAQESRRLRRVACGQMPANTRTTHSLTLMHVGRRDLHAKTELFP